MQELAMMYRYSLQLYPQSYSYTGVQFLINMCVYSYVSLVRPTYVHEYHSVSGVIVFTVWYLEEGGSRLSDSFGMVCCIGLGGFLWSGLWIFALCGF